MNSCKECGGSGVIEVGNRPRECRCAFVRRLAFTMPTYIKKAEIRKAHLELTIMKCLKKHVMVVGAWQDVKAIIKAMMITNPASLIKVTSDREIRDVFVGSKSRANKGDNEGAVYNSLEDLMDPPDLMIVRLNELSYKNKAASGALEESICYRTDRDRATWLISDMDRPFTIGSHAYSDSVADLIKSGFPIFRVPRILPNNFNGENPFDELEPLKVEFNQPEIAATQNATLPKVPIFSPDMSIYTTTIDLEPVDEPEKPEKPVFSKPKIKIQPSDDSDASTSLMDRYGSGVKQSNKFSKNRK